MTTTTMKELLKNVRDIIDAYDLTNRGYLDEGDVYNIQLAKTTLSLLNFKANEIDELFGDVYIDVTIESREEIVGVYAPDHDSTFVMKHTYDQHGDVRKMECVGWYCGEPDDEMTKRFSHGGYDLIATL